MEGMYQMINYPVIIKYLQEIMGSLVIFAAKMMPK